MCFESKPYTQWCVNPAGLLHWFTSPYIHRLTYHRKTGMVDVESLTILARPRHDSFHVTSVEYPKTLKPQSTFQVTPHTFSADSKRPSLQLLTIVLVSEHFCSSPPWPGV